MGIAGGARSSAVRAMCLRGQGGAGKVVRGGRTDGRRLGRSGGGSLVRILRERPDRAGDHPAALDLDLGVGERLREYPRRGSHGQGPPNPQRSFQSARYVGGFHIGRAPEHAARGDRQHTAAVELGLDDALDREPLARPDPTAVLDAAGDR